MKMEKSGPFPIRIKTFMNRNSFTNYSLFCRFFKNKMDENNTMFLNGKRLLFINFKFKKTTI